MPLIKYANKHARCTVRSDIQKYVQDTNGQIGHRTDVILVGQQYITCRDVIDDQQYQMDLLTFWLRLPETYRSNVPEISLVKRYNNGIVVRLECDYRKLRQFYIGGKYENDVQK